MWFGRQASRGNISALALTVLLLLLVCPHAGAYYDVTYTMTYDSANDITTLSNSPSSAGALPFWTTLGPAADYWLALDPGETVEVHSDGTIHTSPGLWDWIRNIFTWDCKNDKHKNKNWVITATSASKPASVRNKTNNEPPVVLFKGDTYNVPKCHRVVVRGPHKATGCELETFDEDTETFIFSDNGWPWPEDQERVELISGSVTSSDNTGAFVSLYTSTCGTGCTPELPSGALALLGGLPLAFAWYKRRRK